MSAALTRLHRRDLRALTRQATSDLSKLWRIAGPVSASRGRLTVGLLALSEAYGPAAATLGADYYDEARDASRARGRYRAAPSAGIAPEALEVLAGVAVGPLFGADPDPLAALTLAAGGLQRHIANEDRETVLQSSIEDPQARGWVRVGGGGCNWCQRYLDGEVHYADGYDFPAHDHCNCTAQPVFG